MAEIIVASIVCTTTTASYTAGDIVAVYWDNVALDFVVYLNDVEETSGGRIFDSYINRISLPFVDVDYYYSISNAYYVTGRDFDYFKSNYSYCVGTTLNEFTFKMSFPYFSRVQTANAPICSVFVCDLAPQGAVRVTSASSSTTNDGTASINVFDQAGGNVKVHLFDFDYLTLGFAATEYATDYWTYDFTSLYPGDYIIWIKDDQGCVRNIKFTIKYNNPEGFGLLYYWEFKDAQNKDHKIELYSRDYAGSSTEKTKLGAVPCELAWNGDGNNPFKTIIPSELTLNLYNVADREYLTLVEDQDEKKYFVKLYHKPSTTYVLKWQGYNTQEISSEPYEAVPYVGSMIFTDRLQDLDKEPFTQKGRDSLFNILRNCLDKLSVFNSYILGFNTYEAGHDSAATDDPLIQTFINTSMYYSENGDVTCYDVIQNILKPLGCRLYSQFGYWYIEELKNKSAGWDYREYSSAGVYVANSTISTIVDFKGATESSRAILLTGSNSLTLADKYGKINVISKRDILEGLAPSFTEKNAIYSGDQIVGFEGWSFKNGGESGSWLVRESSIEATTVLQKNERSGRFEEVRINQYSVTDYDVVSAFINDGNPDAYIQKSGVFEQNETDLLRITIPFKCDMYGVSGGRSSRGGNVVSGGTSGGARGVGNLPFYLRIKWSLKIGSYYLLSDGSYSLTETVNYYFAEKINEWDEFSINTYFRAGATTRTENYELKIYTVSSQSYDATTTEVDQTPVKALVQSFLGVDLPLGYRIIIFLSTIDLFMYYTLKFSGDANSDYPDRIKTTDVSTASWYLDDSWAGGAAQQTDVSVRYKSVDIQIIPSGNESLLTDESTITAVISENNVKELDYEINHFDVDTSVNNTEQLVTNYFQLQDGTPTQSWGAEAVRIQDKLKNDLAVQYQKSRYSIRGSMRADLDIMFHNVIRQSSDNNKIFSLNRLVIDFKANKYQYEIMEMEADTDTTGKAYTSGYSGGYS
jgi:hypothetical protein